MAQSPETDYERQRAVELAWKREVELVKTGGGTRDWSVTQQAEMLATGRVSGFEGSHMLSVQQHPELAGNPDNIQFLPTSAHLNGVHHRNFRAETLDGMFDENTGEIVPFEDGKLPSIEDRTIPLKDLYDANEFTEAYDTLGQSGSARKQEFKDSRAKHTEKSTKNGFSLSEDEYLKSLDKPPEKTVPEEQEQEQTEEDEKRNAYEANLDQGPASEETNERSQDNSISY